MRGTLRQSLGGIALISVACGLVTWLGREIIEARREARGSQCLGHLTQISLALHNYHAAFGCFPPAYVTDARGTPMHSWRVLVLPYIEQSTLYNAYNFDEPWNGPSNSRLARFKPAPYSCPNGNDYSGASNRTNFLAIVGPGTVFPGSRPTSIPEVQDGTAYTIMIAEVADIGIHWMEPRDLDVGAMSLIIDDLSRPSISSHDPRGPHVLCVDGSRPLLRKSISPQTLKALTTIDGGEPLPAEWAR